MHTANPLRRSASPTRRRALRVIGATLVGAAAPATAPAAARAPSPASPSIHTRPATARASGTKVLRLLLPINPVGLDPAGVADTVSAAVVDALFDAPLRYDYLAQPAQLRPNTLAEMPEVSADFTRFVFRLQPGIHFADDPVFQGHPRELTAADCVYSVKRLFDPKVPGRRTRQPVKSGTRARQSEETVADHSRDGSAGSSARTGWHVPTRFQLPQGRRDARRSASADIAAGRA